MEIIGGFFIIWILAFGVIGLIWRAVNRESHERFRSNTKKVGLTLLTRLLRK